MIIRFYKSGSRKVPITFEDAATVEKWDKLCAKIKKEHPHDPHPYYEDYFKFNAENDARRRTEAVHGNGQSGLD